MYVCGFSPLHHYYKGDFWFHLLAIHFFFGIYSRVHVLWWACYVTSGKKKKVTVQWMNPTPAKMSSTLVPKTQEALHLCLSFDPGHTIQ